MSTDQVNVLNTGLMLASCVAAFLLPFELFLAAYAILGPLHYLTQISWLHTRGYFTTAPRDYLTLLGLGVALFALRYGLIDVDPSPWATTVVAVSFASAAAMAFSTDVRLKIGVAVAAFVAATFVRELDTMQVLLLTFVPTIIHVYVFTAAFILYGALRGRSATGIASLAVFAACTASLFLLHPESAGANPGDYVRATYALFEEVNLELAAWLGIDGVTRAADVYASGGGLTIMRFIAFAYTYHYLNWFSKTSVIQWHKIPRSWAVANVVLWIGAVSLYAWDYSTGLGVLFALSWLHVLLELPLDHRTFVGIGKELAALGAKPLSATAYMAKRGSAP
jgi:hypothetical protein